MRGYGRGRGMTLKLLEQLNELEIAAKLPVPLRDLSAKLRGEQALGKFHKAVT
ncbi:hypothetical protein [Aminobacter sp. HY435]|uniref:hypothetical protein n=1 Tax=Aminobacter sp. HY435 TaxID=2970917 RepID=UPI0022B94B0C|nr:hypothetical protein [Aminobacter sp. HY435]